MKLGVFLLVVFVATIPILWWRWRRPTRRVLTSSASPTPTPQNSVDESDTILGIQQKADANSNHHPVDASHWPSYIALHVAAHEHQPFSGYELLQSLLSCGLRYGKMNIFHRHEQKTGQGRVLFSVASMTKPGTFDLPSMGGFRCVGLTLFFVPRECQDPQRVLQLMFETANQLIEDLGGQLLDDQFQPLDDTKMTAMYQALQQTAKV